ncbi:RING-type E3 ubiquitin-protein ligase PPIL2 [Brachyhypopomus gauderio]|uniref:RING-type E3 ubiquitin-protein ligase PPIL2 n=1 Tax=Brachyhypopomus gauderio TaxID=698409 RepID=UPI0040418301
MGKRQHQKDKMYITCTEYTHFYGGKKAEIPQSNFRRLPFDHCSLSLQPFEYPMCTPEGVVFDLMSIVPWIKKFGTNPISGEKLEAKSLIKLNFSKNSEGKYHCPVLYNVFTNNSHIVANRVTGNVFSHEAVEQLNIKTKSYKDLLTDEPFTRQDIITLQVCVCVCAHYSTGRVSASFTSTAMAPATTHQAGKPLPPICITEDAVRYKYVKKKGYVRLHTNKGDLNLELHCDKVPKAGENFIKLCKKGYYDGTIFIAPSETSLIQGGDPTGTGTGGESCWGRPFADEFKPNLSHTGRGVLSMANTGPNTNKSQFFITFRSCTYLDRKHTVFGRVVGGFEALTAMENVESDPKTDRPKTEIKLLRTSVFVDPYEEADEQIAAERAEETRRQEEELAQSSASLNKNKDEQQPKTYRPGIGKYINITAVKRTVNDDCKASTSESASKKVKGRSGFGDFSSW